LNTSVKILNKEIYVATIVLIGLGGFIGSVLRYGMSGVVQSLAGGALFPVGTLVVNLTGCFVIGFLSQLADAREVFTPESRAFVFVGILGGFTTFSTFGNESINLFRGGENIYAFVYVGAHVLLGLGAVWLGRAAAFALWR
jgi:CrcB protein